MAIEIIRRTVNSTKERVGHDSFYDIQVSLNSDGRLVIRYIPRQADVSEKLIVFGAFESSEIIRFIGKLDRLNQELDRISSV